jgi:hypothetical protein
MPLPIGQAIAFFYYDFQRQQHKILSSYYNVPYLSGAKIEKLANGFLANFQANTNTTITTYAPPAKYFSKIVRFLGFDMEPHDLQWELGPGVIAATDFKARIIAYDVSLDKDTGSEGLIVTSGGHEIGHIVLRHDRLIEKAKNSVALDLPDELQELQQPIKMGSYVVCRRPSGAKPRLEFMCDEFMGCLLMPCEMVAEFVRDHFDWCFRQTDAEWTGIAQMMARNFGVNYLAAAVRLTRLGYIQDVSQAGCRVRSIDGWKGNWSKSA